MTEFKRVFFVFNKKGVETLSANPALLSDIKCVISAVPGVNLDSLGASVQRMTLEEALAAFSISQRSIAESASAYTLWLFDRKGIANALPILGREADESLRLALLNHVGLLTHNAFAFEALFKALLRNGLSEACAFQVRGGYRLIERLDIRTFLHVDLSFWPHLVHLCAESEVKLTGFSFSGWFAPFRNALRDLLLFGYKAKTLIARSWHAGRPVRGTACELAVVVRARTEVVAAAPILNARAAQGHKDIMLVDDLIKSPDGTLSAAASGLHWVALHSYSRSFEVAWLLLRCLVLRGKAAREALAMYADRTAAAGFLGRPEIAQKIIYTAFASVPELLIHRIQVSRALHCLKPQAIVSFDTVDRWGAMQGELARQARVRSVMIQNTAADDIVYPWPLAMDNLVVANEQLRRVFIASGADPDRVHAYGLPLQDAVIKQGDARLQALCERATQGHLPLRVLVATQPFVQEFDYNTALIEDLEAATRELKFRVEWVLKPHPREVFAYYFDLREKLTAKGIPVTLFAGPFEAALSEVDLVLSRTSTSLEFSALGGVPGIAHLARYPADIIDRLDYLKSSVTQKSFDRAGLCSLLQRYTPNTRQEALSRYAENRAVYLDVFYPGRGRSTQRVLELVKNGVSSC